MTTSSVVYTTIDENFPVAGQDNDSQGFRDNFNIIKTSLNSAYTELSGLLTNACRFDNSDNNFGYNAISYATFRANVFQANTTYQNGLNSSVTISANDGNCHVVTATGDITLTLGNWPAAGYTFIRVVLFGDGTARNVTFAADNGGIVRTDGNAAWSSKTITVTSTTDPVILEAFSYNIGQAVYIRYLGNFA